MQSRTHASQRLSATIALLCASIAAVGLCGTATAQSNATIYGILDAGVTRVSNLASGPKNSLATGILSPNLLGFTGREDLGSGQAAIFKLESQFELDTGVTDGPFFGHTSYVGLTDNKLGSVTAGTQIDFMFRSLTLRRYGPVFPFISLQNTRQGPFGKLGVPGWGSFDFDRTAAAPKVSNSLLYESPDISGFNFGGLYGLGEGTAGRTVSAGVDYTIGAVQLDAAFTDVKYPQLGAGNQSIRNAGVGGRIGIGSGYVDGLYTNTKNTASGAAINAFEAGTMVPFGNVRAVVAYQFMRGNAQLSNYKAQQLNVGLYYPLSKRTDIYVNLIGQWASGNGARAAIIGTPGESSGSSQALARIGVQHGF